MMTDCVNVLTALSIMIYMYLSTFVYMCGDRIRRLATDPVVMRSIPATEHIRCALLANQPK